MKQRSGTRKEPAEKVVKEIRRATRKRHSSEEKIRIVLAGLRGEESIAALCRREGIAESLSYSWSKEFLEAGKGRLAGDTARQATSPEVKELRAEAVALKEVVVLAFENNDHPVGPWLDRALEICRDFGGGYDDGVAKNGEGHHAGAAGAWRHAFTRMPYYKKTIVEMGVITDTFETAITWERFPAFYQAVIAATEAAAREVTGQPGSVSCRFTHCCPDGPAPYFSFQAKGRHGVLAEQWLAIKSKALDAVIANGGTITHHHAVGRDHMPWYNRQRPDLFADALAGAKGRLDPKGILNHGVLLPAPA